MVCADALMMTKIALIWKDPTDIHHVWPQLEIYKIDGMALAMIIWISIPGL